MKDLIELQDRDCLWPRRTFRLYQLFWIKRLAHENVHDFAGARNAITGDLCIVDVELGFAVAPITVVLQQSGRELREEASAQKQCNRHQKAWFEHRAQSMAFPSSVEILDIERTIRCSLAKEGRTLDVYQYGQF